MNVRKISISFLIIVILSLIILQIIFHYNIIGIVKQNVIENRMLGALDDTNALSIPQSQKEVNALISIFEPDQKSFQVFMDYYYDDIYSDTPLKLFKNRLINLSEEIINQLEMKKLLKNILIGISIFFICILIVFYFAPNKKES